MLQIRADSSMGGDRTPANNPCPTELIERQIIMLCADISGLLATRHQIRLARYNGALRLLSRVFGPRADNEDESLVVGVSGRAN